MRVIVFAVVLFAVLFFGVWALYGATNRNPCKPFSGNRTGTLEYRGHTFTCWHGEIVGMR